MRWAGLATLLVASASGFVVTKLPRPPFPAPVASADAATHIRVVSARYHVPAVETISIDVYGLPRSFRGAALRNGVLGRGHTLLLYGNDGASARYLLAFDTNGRFLYGFDFGKYARPPRIRPGERELVYEEVVWAREADNVL